MCAPTASLRSNQNDRCLGHRTAGKVVRGVQVIFDYPPIGASVSGSNRVLSTIGPSQQGLTLTSIPFQFLPSARKNSDFPRQSWLQHLACQSKPQQFSLLKRVCAQSFIGRFFARHDNAGNSVASRVLGHDHDAAAFELVDLGGVLSLPLILSGCVENFESERRRILHFPTPSNVARMLLVSRTHDLRAGSARAYRRSTRPAEPRAPRRGLPCRLA